LWWNISPDVKAADHISYGDEYVIESVDSHAMALSQVLEFVWGLG
jgi:hypothetical protein